MDKIEKTIENTGNAAENVSETSMKAKEIPPSGSWPVLNRQFKASIFAMLFNNKENLLELYNAVNETDYENPGELEVVTLENAIYMGIKNDVSCILDFRLSLYEHQSTRNPNMPLRFLQYAADQYSELTKNENLYGKKAVHIPAPRFIVFYNGIEEQPDRQILRLSDVYWTMEEEPALELEAVVLNVNRGHNQELMDACQTLKEYAEFVARVRTYHNEAGDIRTAVERAVTECIKEGILAEFLHRNRAEVIKMSIYEFDVERFLKLDRKENFDDGFSQGLEQGIERGREQGISQGIVLTKEILSDYAAGMSASEIAKHRNTTVELVEQIIG